MEKTFTVLEPVDLLAEAGNPQGTIIRRLNKGEQIQYTREVIRKGKHFLAIDDKNAKKRGYIDKDSTSIALWEDKYLVNASSSYFTIRIINEEKQNTPMDSFLNAIDVNEQAPEGMRKLNIEIRNTPEDKLYNYSSFYYDPKDVIVESRKIVAGERLLINPFPTQPITGYSSAVRENGISIYIPQTLSFSNSNTENEGVITVVLGVIIMLIIMAAFYLAGWIVFGKLLFIIGIILAGIIITILKFILKAFSFSFSSIVKRF